MRCRWANLVTYLQQIQSRFFFADEDNFTYKCYIRKINVVKKIKKTYKIVTKLYVHTRDITQ